MPKKRILYLGLDPQAVYRKIFDRVRNQMSERSDSLEIVHFPLIQIQPVPFADECIRNAFSKMPQYTHCLFTSKTAVAVFHQHSVQANLSLSLIRSIPCIAIGDATAQACLEKGSRVPWIAKEQQAEGVISLLKKINLKNADLLFPCSKRARSLIPSFLDENKISHTMLPLYDVCQTEQRPFPNLLDFNVIIVTSPSVVEAFYNIYKEVPAHCQCIPIGPVTERVLTAKKNLCKCMQNSLT